MRGMIFCFAQSQTDTHLEQVTVSWRCREKAELTLSNIQCCLQRHEAFTLVREQQSTQILSTGEFSCSLVCLEVAENFVCVVIVGENRRNVGEAVSSRSDGSQ